MAKGCGDCVIEQSCNEEEAFLRLFLSKIDQFTASQVGWILSYQRSSIRFDRTSLSKVESSQRIPPLRSAASLPHPSNASRSLKSHCSGGLEESSPSGIIMTNGTRSRTSKPLPEDSASSNEEVSEADPTHQRSASAPLTPQKVRDGNSSSPNARENESAFSPPPYKVRRQ